MSLVLDVKRITKEGMRSFSRNQLVSLASIVVMTMSLLILAGVMLFHAVLGFSLAQLENRVDVNLYFYPDTPEIEIQNLATTIEDISGVRDVVYVSRTEALTEFQKQHKDDPLIQRSLDELGENPLGASLNIRAYDSTRYQDIVEDIESLPVVANTDFVERINYYDNQELINRLNEFSRIATSVGYAITMFFAAVAVMVIISTLRLAIFSSKDDIIVKRLVGAEDRYIQGPFLVQGVTYGLISTLITFIILFPITRTIGSYTDTFFGGMNIAQYYQTNALQMLIILLVFSAILGIIASAISVKKYLRV